MAVEMNKAASVRLSPVQEIKLAKPATELYVGQILKTVVVTALTNNQVTININGESVNARTSEHFKPGELLDLKVIANGKETVLEVVTTKDNSATLQAALRQALPIQAPATNLLQTMAQLLTSSNLPGSTNQQIRAFLNSITPLSQLPQQLMQAINQSGVFLESNLFEWQKGMSQQRIQADFKGQCLKLLNNLSSTMKESVSLPADLESKLLAKDTLPLTGAIPQPLPKESFLNLLNLSSETIQQLLHDQVSQVLARITAHQIHHLSQDSKDGFLLMLDLPIKTPEGVEVVPLMITEHKALPMEPSKWSVSFAVNLANLGDLQGTVALSAKNTDVKFNVERPETLELLDHYQSEMTQVLASLGLKLRDWKLQLGLENNHIDVENLHLLDIRI